MRQKERFQNQRGKCPQKGDTSPLDFGNVPILTAKNLKKYFTAPAGFFKTSKTQIKAVDGVNIELKYGETLGIVGETGSGKTTLAKLLVGLYKPTAGKIYYEDSNKLVRKNIQMVFQDPYNSLDPRMKINDALKEGIIIHNIVESSKVRERLLKLLDMVELPRASLSKYPHEFSGGEKQRIAIARALSCEPKLVIYDEPVSSLDVSIQGKILHLLLELQQRLNLSYVFISHDILVVRAISDRIAVMYQGKIVEEGATGKICETPSAAYTKQLMSAASYGKIDM